MEIYKTSTFQPNLESSQLDHEPNIETSTKPGLGGMQGKMVAVGNGDGHHIQEDSSQSAGGLFGFLGNCYSAFWDAATEVFGPHDYYDDENDETEEVEVSKQDKTTLIKEDDGDEDQLRLANKETSSETITVPKQPLDEVIDRILVDAQEDLSSSIDSVEEDDEQFYSFDSVDEGNDTHALDEEDLLRLTNDKTGSEIITVPKQPLDELITKTHLEEISEIELEEPPREEVNKEVQQQQGYVMSFLSGAWNVGAAIVTPVVNHVVAPVLNKAVEVTGNMVGAVVSYATGSESEKVPEKKLSLADKNLSEMRSLNTTIENKLDKLNEQLKILGSKELTQPESQRLDKPQLTMWDTLNRWKHQTTGAFSATISTLGWGAVGAGVATGGSLVPHLGVQVTSVLGGTFLGLSALRDFPSLAHNNAAISLVEEALQDLEKDFAKLENLKAQEKSRQDSLERTMIITMERNERVNMLQTELASVSNALKTAPTSNEKDITSRHELVVSDGTQRRETLGVIAKTKQAFQSFFSAIGSGIASIGRFIADLPNVPGRFMERRAAGKAELAYQQGEGKAVLSMLSFSGENSVLKEGADVRAKERAIKDGGTQQSLQEVRKQIIVGENLSRSILSSKEGTFGATIVEDESGKKLAVTANLTTARSLAWYLDTLAEESEHEDPNAPQVKRGDDGALIVSDPDGKLYSFLMHAPTAYTRSMTDTEGESSTLGALRMDDYHSGFPQGGRGMQFERTLDEEGNSVLRMTFPKEQGQPIFKPLSNQRQVLMGMYEALHSSSQTIGGSTDYSNWTKEQLQTRYDFLNSELERQGRLIMSDQEQIEQLQNWQNPAFV